ncbi:MAG: hypothetical protein ACQEWD_00740 [Bacteroidota bacterium]
MRILVTIFAFCFYLSSNAQVGQAESVDEGEVIGIANKSVGLPKLEKIKVEDQNLFILTFYNLEYIALKEIDNISFYASNEDINYLYNFLQDQLKNKESKTLLLGDNEIMATKVSSSVRIDILGKDSWFYLSRKQLERLFGKR